MDQKEFNQKKNEYEMSIRFSGFFGHRYHGFEGVYNFEGKRNYSYSQTETDNRKRVLAECQWVWDRKVSKWIKTPQTPVQQKLLDNK